MDNLKDRAGEQIETRIQQGTHRAADTLNDVAASLLNSSQNLRDRGNENVSRYMEKAADQFDRLASYLDRADVHELLDQAESFARRQPAAFIAGAVAMGFLGARFLKSSRGGLSSGDGLTRVSDTGRSYGTTNFGTIRYPTNSVAHD